MSNAVLQMASNEMKIVSGKIEFFNDTSACAAIKASGANVLELYDASNSTTEPVELKNVAAPSESNSASNKFYVDDSFSMFAVKEPVRAATTANLTSATTANTIVITSPSSGYNTVSFEIDGVSLVEGDRLLVKNNANDTQNYNGVYTVGELGGATLVLTRASDMNTTAKAERGAYCFVANGLVNSATMWYISSEPSTLNSSALVFSQFSAAGGGGFTTAGDGLSSTGDTVSVIGITNRIFVDSNGVDISENYTGQTTINTLGTVATGVWEATPISSAYLSTDLTIEFGSINSTPIGDVGASSATFTSCTVTGVASLESTLGVTGLATLSDSLDVTLNATVGGTLGVTGSSTLSGGLGVTGTTTTDDLVVNGVATLNSNLDVTGAFGVTGSATCNDALSVLGATDMTSFTASGPATLNSSLDVTGNTVMGNLEATGATFQTLDVLGGVIFSNNMQVTGVVTCNDSVDVLGTLSAYGTTVTSLNASAAVTFTSTLDVTDLVSANGGLSASTLTVQTAATMNDTLEVQGVATFQTALTANGAASCTDSLTVEGSATMNSTLDVVGITTTGTLDVNGSATMNTTLGVTGAATLSSTLDVTGASTLTSASLSSFLDVTGDTTLSGVLDVTGLVTALSGIKMGVDQSILDSNAAQVLGFGATSSAASNIKVSNAAGSSPPVIESISTQGAAGLELKVKSTGKHVFSKSNNSGRVEFDVSAKLTNQVCTLSFPAGVSNTIVVPAVSDTLVGLATADTLTNKTLTSPVVNNATISGGAMTTTTINNCVIGGSTQAAGSFTTLSAAATTVSSTLSVTSAITASDGINFGSNKSINDSNAAKLIEFPVSVASAVNYVRVTNAAAASHPVVSAAGTDTNIQLRLQGKGTGSVMSLSNVLVPEDGFIGTPAKATLLQLDGSGSVLNVAGTVTQTSDAALKENLRLCGGLDVVERLRGVEWEWTQPSNDAVADNEENDSSSENDENDDIDDNKSNKNKKSSEQSYRNLMSQTSAGVVAQEVQGVLPFVVYQSSNGLLSVNYNAFHGILINAVKELSSTVRALSEKVLDLESKLKKK